MKTWIYALLSLLTITTQSASAAPQPMNHVVAIVNNGVILQTDLDTAMKTIQVGAQQKGQELPEYNVLRKQVLDKLIVDEIQDQEATRMGIQVDDQRLDQAIADIAKNNNLTIDQLRASLAQQGLTYSAFRANISKEISQSDARNAQVRHRINISPSEIETLATQLTEQNAESIQYKISQIQINFDDDVDKQETEDKAQEITSQVKNGADFAKLAYSSSNGTRALDGGDWGWMRKEEMPTIFADQITTQSKGAIIGPFRSGVGFHILRIDDVKGLATVAVTEAKVQHILIKPSVILSDEGARKELLDFTAQINAGTATLGELAQEYSEDPGSAINDGILDYQTPTSYVPSFREAVETLPVGKLSEPVKTQFGWHLIKVLDRRSVDKTEDALKDRAYQILFKRKFNEEASAWIQEARATAYVEILDSNATDLDNTSESSNTASSNNSGTAK